MALRKLTDQPTGDVGLRPLPRGVPAARDAPPRSRGHRPVTPHRKARARPEAVARWSHPVGPGRRHLAHGLDPSPHASPVTDASARLCPPAGTLKPSARVSASEPQDPPDRQAGGEPAHVQPGAHQEGGGDSRVGGRPAGVPGWCWFQISATTPYSRHARSPGRRPCTDLHGTPLTGSTASSPPCASATRVTQEPICLVKRLERPARRHLGHLPLPQLGWRIHSAILLRRPPERSIHACRRLSRPNDRTTSSGR